MDYAELRNGFASIEGWFDEPDGIGFIETINQLESNGIKGKIAEIGSWKGRSSSYVAYAAKLVGQKAFCIDPFVGSAEHQEEIKAYGGTTFRIFTDNMKRIGLYDNIITIASPSYIAHEVFEPNSIRFLFIDGAHEYEEVKLDFDLFKGKICMGGVVAFHDVDAPQVKKAVDEAIASGEFELYRSYSSKCMSIVKIK